MEELIPIFFFLCVAAVLILRPLTKRLGMVIEQVARDRHAGRIDDAEIARLRVAIDHLAKRLDLAEERVDFTERLVGSRRPRSATNDLLSADTMRYEDRETSYLGR